MSFFRKIFLASSTAYQKRKYSGLFSEFGESPESLHWSSRENQRLRFEVLFSLLTKNDAKSILDVGCGFGDFLTYIKAMGSECDYFGIDQVDGFIKIAQSNWPDASWATGDFLHYEFDQKFDVVVFCGTFAFGNRKFFKASLQKAFGLAKNAVIFNLYHSTNKLFFHLDQKNIGTMIKEIGYKRVEILDSYHKFDKTYRLFIND